MRIGIFGGTFNPIHMGHLITIECIRSEFALDRVILIPARIPVHKEVACSISAEDRLHMVKLAAEGVEWLGISLLEIEKDAPSYTIDTVNDLMKIYSGSELFLIIGGDSFNEIGTWMRYRELVRMIPLIVMKRHDSMEYRRDIIEMCREVSFADNPIIGISSTAVRERIRRKGSVRFHLPDRVADYIKTKGLYTN